MQLYTERSQGPLTLKNYSFFKKHLTQRFWTLAFNIFIIEFNGGVFLQCTLFQLGTKLGFIQCKRMLGTKTV